MEGQTATTAAPQTAAPATQAPQTTETPKAPDQSAAAKLLAGRYKTASDLEQGYKQAQAELTKTKQELAELRKGQAAPAAPAQAAAESAPKAEAATELQGSAYDAIMSEYLSNQGKVSDASVQAAAKQMGVPDAEVRDFIAFKANQVQSGLTKIEDHFKEVGKFSAAEFLNELSDKQPPDVVHALGTLIQKGEFEVLRPYLSAHVKAKLPAGQVGQVSGSGAGGFSSVDERRKAMLDRRFGSDKKYTAEFWAKNEASAPEFKMPR